MNEQTEKNTDFILFGRRVKRVWCIPPVRVADSDPHSFQFLGSDPGLNLEINKLELKIDVYQRKILKVSTFLIV